MGLADRLRAWVATEPTEPRLTPLPGDLERLPPAPILPEDPVPVPEPGIEERFPVPHFLDAVRGDGSIDWERIAEGGSAPSVPVTADQAIAVLRSLPDNATPGGRYTAMKDALGGAVDERIPELVTDAAHQMVDVNRFLVNARSENAAFQAAVGAEIARLEEMAARLCDLRSRVEGDALRVLDAVRERVDHMTGIIAFFDEFQAMHRYERETGRDPYAAPDLAVLSVAEPPPFAQDDNVLRLLGVPGSDPTQRG